MAGRKRHSAEDIVRTPCSPRQAGRRQCCGWTKVRSWFLKRCNGSAMGRSACPTSRPDRRGTTATSNRSTTDFARSASTATTGPPVRGPSGDRRLQNTSTTTDTGIQPWATERRPSTPRHAYPHPGGLRDLLNPRHNNPTLISGGLNNGDSPVNLECGGRTCVRAVEEAARGCRRFLQLAQGVGGFGFEFVLAGDAGLADAVVLDVLSTTIRKEQQADCFSGSIKRRRPHTQGCWASSSVLPTHWNES